MLVMAAYVFDVVLVLIYSCDGGNPSLKPNPQTLALFKVVKL